MNKTDIVITTFNRLEFTNLMLEHIKSRTTTPYRIIVVDNNSTDGTQAYLYEKKKAGEIHHLLLLEENYGIHMAKNYGLALVRSEPYYIDTDNDLLCPSLTPDWISQLTRLMDKHPQYGAIACRPQVLVGQGGNPFENPGEVIQFDHVGAHLRIMRTEDVRMSGGWARDWNAKRNSEDGHIAGNLRTLGLKVGYAKHVRCWHQFGTEENTWGYKGMKPEEHGHREMWPTDIHYEATKPLYNDLTWEEK